MQNALLATLCMDTYGHQMMVTETSKTTNFLGHFFYNMLFYCVFNNPIDQYNIIQLASFFRRMKETKVTITFTRGVGAGPAGLELAKPLFQGKNRISFLQKVIIKQDRSASVIFRLVRLVILLYSR